MPKWIQLLDDWLEKIERGLAVSLYFLLIGMICFNIVVRNLLHFSSHRLLELAPTVVLWLALVGATLALKHRRHIKIELLLRLMSPAARRVAVVLTNLFSMGICALLAWAAVPFVLNEAVLFGAWGWMALCFPMFFGTAFLRFGLNLLWPDRDMQGGQA